jgi:hypothetical protein
VNFTLGFGLENLTLTGAGNINGTGNGNNNVITGNGANNILNGGSCYDHIFLAPHLPFIQIKILMRLGCRFIQQTLNRTYAAKEKVDLIYS